MQPTASGIATSRYFTSTFLLVFSIYSLQTRHWYPPQSVRQQRSVGKIPQIFILLLLYWYLPDRVSHLLSYLWALLASFKIKPSHSEQYQSSESINSLSWLLRLSLDPCKSLPLFWRKSLHIHSSDWYQRVRKTVRISESLEPPKNKSLNHIYRTF